MITAVIDETISSGIVAMEPATLGIMHELRDFIFAGCTCPKPGPAGARSSQLSASLSTIFLDNPQEIPDFFRQDEADPLKHVMDYVAGMTDRYALRLHNEMFRPD